VIEQRSRLVTQQLFNPVPRPFHFSRHDIPPESASDWQDANFISKGYLVALRAL